PDHLGLRGARIGEPAESVLAATDRDLVLALLRDPDHRAADVLARHQLVDEAAGRLPAAGDQPGAHAIRVDWRGRERRDRPLVEVGRDDHAGLRGTEVVELAAYLVCEHAEVAGVEPDRAEL